MFRRGSCSIAVVLASSSSSTAVCQQSFRFASSPAGEEIKSNKLGPVPKVQYSSSPSARNDYLAYARKVSFVHSQQMKAEAAAAPAVPSVQERGDQNKSEDDEAGVKRIKEDEASKEQAGKSKPTAEKVSVLAVDDANKTPPPKTETASGKSSAAGAADWNAEPIMESMEMNAFLADTANLYWALGDVMTRHVNNRSKEFDFTKAMLEIESPATTTASSSSSTLDGSGKFSSGGSSSLKYDEKPAIGLPHPEAFLYPEFGTLLKKGYNSRAHTNPHQVACSKDCLIKAHLISFEEAPLSRYKPSYKEEGEHVASSIKDNKKKKEHGDRDINAGFLNDPYAGRACFATVELQLVTPVERHCGTLFTKYLRRAQGLKDPNESRCLAALMSQAGGFTHSFVNFWDWCHQKMNKGKPLVFGAPDASLWERMPEPFPQVSKGGVASRKRVKFVRFLEPMRPAAAAAGVVDVDASAKDSTVEKEEKKEEDTTETTRAIAEEEEALAHDLAHEGNWRVFSSVNDGVDVGVSRARI